MMKKNLGAHVILQPPAFRLNHNDFEIRTDVADDFWVIEDVSDDGVKISDPRTGHFRLLGYDHIQKFTTDGEKDGARRGFLTLHVQLFVKGNQVRVVPNARPGEAVAAKKPEIVEHTVEFNYPTASRLQQRLKGKGYSLHWSRADLVKTRVDTTGCEIVLEPESPGVLARFRTTDGLMLLKKRG